MELPLQGPQQQQQQQHWSKQTSLTHVQWQEAGETQHISPWLQLHESERPTICKTLWPSVTELCMGFNGKAALRKQETCLRTNTVTDLSEGLNLWSGDTRSTDTRSTDTRSTDTRSTDTRSTDTRSTDTRSTDTRSTDTRSTDTRSTDTRSTDTRTTDRDHVRGMMNLELVTEALSPVGPHQANVCRAQRANALQWSHINAINIGPRRLSSAKWSGTGIKSSMWSSGPAWCNGHMH